MAKSENGRMYKWFRKPIHDFLETEASGGVLLVATTIIALVWANSRYGAAYNDLWHIVFSLGWGDNLLSLTLHHWINDGLMAIFFFYVGLEIKREVLTGELASWKKASLPCMAAIGGMIVPAVLFTVFNAGTEGARGWGIPMATDIAFALGILMLLGKRVPLGLKVFLTALAVVDDLGAVLVIAIFYTSGVSLHYLALGLAFALLSFLLGRIGKRRRIIFVGIGIVVWYCFLKSGVHATVAGVLVAMTIPHRVEKGRKEFVTQLDGITDELYDPERAQIPVSEEVQIVALQAIRGLINKAESPLQRLEYELHPIVAFGIMPIFALANAGVVFELSALSEAFRSPIPLGILFGLVIGKQVGIFAFSWAAVKIGWASLPSSVNWAKLYGVAILGGIGFTMSLFISNLAFGTAHGEVNGHGGTFIDQAKLGIILASTISAILGVAVLLAVSKPGEAKTLTGPFPVEDDD